MFDEPTISIYKCANGWHVSVPLKRVASFLPPGISKGQMRDYVQGIQELSQSDPVLDELMGKDDEPFNLPTPPAVVPIQENVFVFAHFTEVIKFLSQRFA